MRVAVHDYAGHPFQVQLSRELARRGHDVLHLYCASEVTGRGAVRRVPSDPGRFDVEGVSLGETWAKYSPWKRPRHERRYAARLTRRLEPFRPAVVVSANTPLLAQQRLLGWCRRRGVAFVFWQQDIVSVGADRILRRRYRALGRAAGRGFLALERRLLRRSGAIVCVAEDFRRVLAGWGVDGDHVFVIENWAPLDELPVVERDNAWAREHGLDRMLVALYSGTLGLKHDPGLLLRLAAHVRTRPDVRVVVVSEGIGASWLRERAAAEGLDNLVLVGYQPYERLPEVLGTGDVLLAVLEPDAGVFSVPSKVLSYHCAGRPLVAAVPAENAAAKVILAAGSGRVVEPGRPEGLEAAVDELLGDPALRARLGRNARAYAEATFDIRAIADRFETVLDRARGASIV